MIVDRRLAIGMMLIPIFNLQSSIYNLQFSGAVAQLGEHQLCKLGVRGSIPLSSTRDFEL